jgi:hypothetical protein
LAYKLITEVGRTCIEYYSQNKFRVRWHEDSHAIHENKYFKISLLMYILLCNVELYSVEIQHVRRVFNMQDKIMRIMACDKKRSLFLLVGLRSMVSCP